MLLFRLGLKWSSYLNSMLNLMMYMNLCLFQVSGCLSYADKISDGFYNILGMNPYLWVMCNDLEEGRRLPSLMSLQEVEPGESSMEVVLIDKRGDSRLKELEDKAQELFCDSENTLVLVKRLGKLVAISMGYVLTFSIAVIYLRDFVHGRQHYLEENARQSQD